MYTAHVEILPTKPIDIMQPTTPCDGGLLVHHHSQQPHMTLVSKHARPQTASFELLQTHLTEVKMQGEGLCQRVSKPPGLHIHFFS